MISDIHGNCVALDAVLADLERHAVDTSMCLGDAVQGGPQPVEVLERLDALACPVIMGNADAYVLTGTVADASPEQINERLRTLRAWGADRLGPAGLDRLSTFVATHEIDVEDAGTLLCFHGSPRSYDEVLLPESTMSELRDALGDGDAATMCGGHTHLQWTTGVDGRRFFNPGSVGLAYNRHDPVRWSPWAEYAVLSTDGNSVALEFCKVPFDTDALLDAARAADHPFIDDLVARYR